MREGARYFILLWYFQRSPIVQLLVLDKSQGILRNEKTAIELEIEEYNKKQEEDDK